MNLFKAIVSLLVCFVDPQALHDCTLKIAMCVLVFFYSGQED